MSLTLAEMRAAAEASRRTVEVSIVEFGGTVLLKQLDAVTGLRIGAMCNAENGQPLDAQRMADYFVAVLTGSIVDDAGVLQCDNDEGQAFLRALPVNILTVLADEAVKLNGMGGEAAKKN